MQTTKPKLGNASMLFKDSHSSGAVSNDPAKQISRSIISRVSGGLAFLSLLAAVLIFQNENFTHAKQITSAPTNDAADEAVAIVHANNESSKLVGTLVRIDTIENTTEAVSEVVPAQLSEGERKQLLEILSTQ